MGNNKLIISIYVFWLVYVRGDVLMFVFLWTVSWELWNSSMCVCVSEAFSCVIVEKTSKLFNFQKYCCSSVDIFYAVKQDVYVCKKLCIS